MKSSKQRRAEIKKRRAKCAERIAVANGHEAPVKMLTGSAPCNPASLAPYNSYGVPPFVERGFYTDLRFQCRICRKEEIWRATQQKWWYEVAKGHVESGANRCNACRRAERKRKAEARRVHLEGLAKKQSQQQ